MSTLHEDFGHTPENDRAYEEWKALVIEIRTYLEKAQREALQTINAKYSLGIYDLLPIKVKLQYTKEVLEVLRLRR